MTGKRDCPPPEPPKPAFLVQLEKLQANVLFDAPVSIGTVPERLALLEEDAADYGAYITKLKTDLDNLQIALTQVAGGFSQYATQCDQVKANVPNLQKQYIDTFFLGDASPFKRLLKRLRYFEKKYGPNPPQPNF